MLHEVSSSLVIIALLVLVGLGAPFCCVALGSAAPIVLSSVALTGCVLGASVRLGCWSASVLRVETGCGVGFEVEVVSCFS